MENGFSPKKIKLFNNLLKQFIIVIKIQAPRKKKGTRKVIIYKETLKSHLLWIWERISLKELVVKRNCLFIHKTYFGLAYH